MDDIIFVYVTTPTPEAAKDIARTIVAEQLAACANILPTMQSVYEWDGQIEEAAESVLLLKTTAGVYARLEARIKALHNYDVPCIVALPLVRVEERFADWIRSQINE